MNRKERQAQTTLRLATARLFTLRLRDEEFRAKFAATSGWSPNSPVVPCESYTLFGEVYATALPALEASGADVAAIPVVHVDPKSKKVKLSVLTVGRDGRPGDAVTSISIDSIDHAVTMKQVCETLSPNKKWDVRDLDAAVSSRLSSLS